MPQGGQGKPNATFVMPVKKGNDNPSPIFFLNMSNIHPFRSRKLKLISKNNSIIHSLRNMGISTVKMINDVINFFFFFFSVMRLSKHGKFKNYTNFVMRHFQTG